MDNQHKKIAGYRDLDEREVLLMNDLKQTETDLAAMLRMVELGCHGADDTDALRWVAIARTHLETGMMYAIKAVALPTNGLGRK